MHLSEKAVDPPGQARPDLDIFLDYARRMDFRDKDGEPLPPWTRRRGGVRGVEAVQRRPALRLHRPELRQAARRAAASNGPATTSTPTAPNGSTPTARSGPHPDYCETYGKDLITGAPVEPTEYRALNPDGKAILKAAEYLPPHELPERGLPVRR